MNIKRYLLSVLLLLFALGGLGAYYGFAAGKSLPGFRLETIEGDAAIGDGIALTGHYKSHSQFVTVTAQGTEYRNQLSPFSFDRFDDAREWYMWHPGIKELIREHRDFMRGKNNPNGLYRDGNALIYAEADVTADRTIRVEIERLDAAAGRTTKHSVNVDAEEELGYAFVNNVQLIDGNLHVIVHSNRKRQPTESAARFRDIVVDVASGELVRQSALEHGLKEGDWTLSQQVLPNDFREPSGYAVMQVTKREEEEGGAQKITDRNLFVYDYASGKLSAMPETVASSGDWSNQYGNRLFAAKLQDDKAILVSGFELPSGAPGGKVTATAEQLGAERIQNMSIVRDRVYLLLVVEGGHQVAVLNASDASVLYRGRVTVEGDKVKDGEELAYLSLFSHIQVSE